MIGYNKLACFVCYYFIIQRNYRLINDKIFKVEKSLPVPEILLADQSNTKTVTFKF